MARPSLVRKSETTAFMSGFAFALVAASASAAPPANDSLRRPNSPLGSAAVMAIPAFMGLRKRRAHSSLVKLVLSDMTLLPEESAAGCVRGRLPPGCFEIAYDSVKPLRGRPAWREGYRLRAWQQHPRWESLSPCHTSG